MVEKVLEIYPLRKNEEERNIMYSPSSPSNIELDNYIKSEKNKNTVKESYIASCKDFLKIYLEYNPEVLND